MSLEIFLCIEIFLLLHYIVWYSFVIIMNDSSINYNFWSHTRKLMISRYIATSIKWETNSSAVEFSTTLKLPSEERLI